MKKAALFASALILLGTLTFLGLKVREFSDVEHGQFQTALWQLKHLGSAFNQSVLEARFAFLDSYDDFQAYERDAQRALETLQSPPEFVTPAGREAIRVACSDYAEHWRTRQDLFDRFKSLNAVLS